MKAFRIDAPGESALVEVPEPRIAGDDVLLRVRQIGFCGPDLSTYLGKNPLVTYPRIPGHEIAATIEAVGPNVPERFSVGRDVTVVPYTSCGVCPACRRGRSNACRSNETLGVQRDGAMTELVALPWRKLIAVDGVGIDRLAFGGALTIDTTKSNLHDSLMSWTESDGHDVVIEAVGHPSTYRTAVEEISFCGRIVCIGYAKEDAPLPTRLFVQKELDIRGSRNVTPEDFRAVAQLLSNRALPLERVVSEVVPLSGAGDALRRWSQSPAAITKILIEM